MDFSCKNCFHIWICSWCKNRWCDDTGMPFFLKENQHTGTQQMFGNGIRIQKKNKKR